MVCCFSSANSAHFYDATKDHKELLRLHLARYREKGKGGTSCLPEARIWAERQDKANRPAPFTSGGVEARDARTSTPIAPGAQVFSQSFFEKLVGG